MGRRAWIAVLVVALAAGACKSSDDGDAVKSTGSGTRTETLKLGAALSLTGGLAREGVLTREGYDYCKTVVNDKGGVKVGDVTYQLDIAYQDDTSKADVAASSSPSSTTRESSSCSGRTGRPPRRQRPR